MLKINKKSPDKKDIRNETNTPTEISNRKHTLKIIREPKGKEICNECGKSVKLGSGLFVNRVSDLDDYEDRLEMNKPFPEGEFICAECDEKLNQEVYAGNKRISN